MVLGSPIGRACSPFAYRTVTLFGTPFQVIRLGDRFVTLRPSLHTGQIRSHDTGRTTHAGFNVRLGLGCFPFARRYLGNRFCFLFLGVLRCFSSPRWLPRDYVFIKRMTRVCLVGFPHSEISGSTLICSYPKLIAACHVLHRLSTPRHPPTTLTSLTRKSCARKDASSHYPDSIVKERTGTSRLITGGEDRVRTGDLRRARATLSQLSYFPVQDCTRCLFFFVLVGLARVELATSRLSGVRSNQLSYRPNYMK